MKFLVSASLRGHVIKQSISSFELSVMYIFFINRNDINPVIKNALYFFMLYRMIIYKHSYDFDSEMKMYSICIHINYDGLTYLYSDKNSHAVKSS